MNIFQRAGRAVAGFARRVIGRGVGKTATSGT